MGDGLFYIYKNLSDLQITKKIEDVLTGKVLYSLYIFYPDDGIGYSRPPKHLKLTHEDLNKLRRNYFEGKVTKIIVRKSTRKYSGSCISGLAEIGFPELYVEITYKDLLAAASNDMASERIETKKEIAWKKLARDYADEEALKLHMISCRNKITQKEVSLKVAVRFRNEGILGKNGYSPDAEYIRRHGLRKWVFDKERAINRAGEKERKNKNN